jgi:hypothetical protein
VIPGEREVTEMRTLLMIAILAVSLAGLALAGCGGGEEEALPPPAEETAAPPAEEPAAPPAEETAAPPAEGAAGRVVEAPAAAITVDGDASDWESVTGLDLSLEPIEAEESELEPKQATVKAARDDEFVYVLLQVEDDYNWDPENANLSGAAAIMWLIEPEAGAHMGAEDPSGGPSAGMVDIWHWETECAAGEETGGSVSEPGEGNDPGNDDGCNFDDEWALSAAEREDDNGAGAENSLLGVWAHTNPAADAEGTWIFEARRPLQTGDEQDAQLAAGDSVRMALAYWDPDTTPEGWEGDQHAQSANQGWIEVTLAG